MRKRRTFSLVAAACLSALAVYAQKNNVQSAYVSLKNKQYDDAKRYIDLAAQHASTANDPKMWYYRGKIYFTFHAEKEISSVDSSITYPLRRLDPDAIEKALESYLAAMKTEDKQWPILVEDQREVKKDMIVGLAIQTAAHINNKAIDHLNSGQHEKAEKLWLSILDIHPYDEKKEMDRNNLSEKNIYEFCYQNVVRADDKIKQKQFLQKLIDLNFNAPYIYIDMSNLYLEENKMEDALNIVERGRSLFDDDKGLVQQQVYLYVKLNRMDELLARLDADLEDDPEATNVLYLRGLIHQQKIDDKKPLRDNEPHYAAAQKDLKQAAQLEQSNFAYWYDAGSLQYNYGADIINAANDIKDNNKYNAEKKRATERLKDAAASLEMAHRLDPKHLETLRLLKTIYARTDEVAKYEEISAKIAEMEKGEQ